MREDIVFQGVVEDSPVHDLEEFFNSIEIEDGEQTFWKMQLWLQKGRAVLVTLYVGIDSLRCIVKDLLFKPVPEIKDDIISVCVNSESEKINFEFNTGISKILEGESELSAHDENLDGLSRDKELLVSLQELNDMAMREHHFAFTVERVFPLVCHQYGYEVDQLHNSLLVMIDLRSLDLD